jgi:hypothetical protein
MLNLTLSTDAGAGQKGLKLLGLLYTNPAFIAEFYSQRVNGAYRAVTAEGETVAYLNDSYLCLDCEWVGENDKHCEKCGSVGIYPIIQWFSRVPDRLAMMALERERRAGS